MTSDPLDTPDPGERARIAQELNALLSETNLTQQQLGDRIGKSRQLIGGICGGRAALTLRTARLLDQEFRTHGRFEGLLGNSGDPRFLHRYTLIEQQHAKGLFQFQSSVIPALLQTKGYARSTLEASIPPLMSNTVQQRVKSRLDRQQALSRMRPLTGNFVLTESTVLQAVGGSQVMREQWQHLLKCMSYPNITVQILPHRAGAHGSMQGSYTILETNPSGWVVYVETAAGGEVLRQRPLIDDVRLRFNALMVAALSGTETAEYIERLI